jgi:hypothetical protein
MAKTKLRLIAAVIISAMHTGYRRAGIAFDKGENNVEINEVQYKQIAQDHNLLVQSAEPLHPNTDNDTKGPVDDNNVGGNVNEDGLSLDNTVLDLSTAPPELQPIIAVIHAKNCESSLTKKPNCDEFGELNPSALSRDLAWEWYQNNVVHTEEKESE